MTVSSTTTKNSYSGNGSTTTFAYGFKIFANTDLTVILRSATGAETVQTLTTHYTVSNVGVDSGGNVVFVTAPASGVTVLIRRNMALTQSTDYVANDPFPAATHEDALDRLTFISQQMQEEVNRSIKLSRTNTMTSTEFTTSAADRANKILAFDTSGELAVTQELGTYKGTDTTTTTAVYTVRDIIKSTTAGQLNNVYICVAASAIGDVLTDTDHFELIVDAVSAAASATTATTKASEAATSATNAAASYDSFDDRYLGAKGSDPSVDNDGASLITGALYFKTDGSGMKAYNGSAWEDVSPTDAEQTNINTVAGLSTEVAALGASAVIADMALLATTDVIADMALLATTDIIADMNTLATSAIVADLNILATTDIVADMALLATTDIVADMNALATSDIISDLNALATSDIITDMNLLATSQVIADMATLAGSGASPNITSLSTSGDVVVGDDLSLTSDAAVLNFGANSEVNLTHVHDTGLLLNGAMKLQFSDASQFIHAPSATVLDIAATDEIELTATLIDVVGNQTVSGTLGVTGVLTTTAIPLFNGGIDLPTVNTYIKGGGHNVVQVDSTRTYLYGGTNGVQFRTADNASALVDITNAGNVGIGTSSPVNNSGYGGLTLNGANGSILSMKDSDTEVSRFVGSATETSIQYGTSSVLTFRDGLSGGTERMRIDSSGNVGIGTSSPNSKTHIVGAANAIALRVTNGAVDGNNADVMHIEPSNGAYVGKLLRIQSGRSDFSDSLLFLNTTAGINGTNGSYIRMQDQADADIFRIKGDGNVGIGTGSPRAKVDINGGLHLAGGTQIQITGNSGTTGLQLIGQDADVSIVGTMSAQALVFRTGSTERMRIDATGAVTMPLQPAFMVHPSTAQLNIPTNTFTNVVFGTERFDNNSDFASNTFTAPVTGKYQLQVNMRLDSLDKDNNNIQAHIITSNKSYYSIIQTAVFASDPAFWWLGVTVLADMDASDTAYVRLYISNDGAAQMDVQTDSYFSGYLVA
jgi:hypothetical protein